MYFLHQTNRKKPCWIVLISILWIICIDLISLIKSISGLCGAALAVGTGPTHCSPHAKTKPCKTWKVKTSLFHCQWLSLFASWGRGESIALSHLNCALWNSKFPASYVIRSNLWSRNFMSGSRKNCYNPEFTIQVVHLKILKAVHCTIYQPPGLLLDSLKSHHNSIVQCLNAHKLFLCFHWQTTTYCAVICGYGLTMPICLPVLMTVTDGTLSTQIWCSKSPLPRIMEHTITAGMLINSSAKINKYRT